MRNLAEALGPEEVKSRREVLNVKYGYKKGGQSA